MFRLGTNFFCMMSRFCENQNFRYDFHIKYGLNRPTQAKIIFAQQRLL